MTAGRQTAKHPAVCQPAETVKYAYLRITFLRKLESRLETVRKRVGGSMYARMLFVCVVTLITTQPRDLYILYG